jgi:hypothetical protein
MAHVISRRPLTAEALVRTRVNPCGICGGQSGTGIGFSPSSSAPLPISYHRRSPNSYVGNALYANLSRYPPLGTKSTTSSGRKGKRKAFIYFKKIY